MRTYHHLTIEERERLFAWRSAGLSVREIARRLNRSDSSLSREWKRNTRYGREYLPYLAERRAARIGTCQRAKAPLKEPLVLLYVREHLRWGWSPETISGRLTIDSPGYSIDDETIYRYIYARRNRRLKLWRNLTIQRKRRMRKNGRGARREGTIPNAVSIDLRPKEVHDRSCPGHWETDLMEGPRRTSTVLSVTTERQTRYTLLDKLGNKTAREKTASTIRKLNRYPKDLTRSITADNGKENSYHEEIAHGLGVSVFFCHAYASWEKGTVENMIGRIRRWIPRGVPINNYRKEEIAAIENYSNHTPRKCLGYLTPAEALARIMPPQEATESSS